MKKKLIWTLSEHPLPQILGGCCATSFLKIWDVIPSLPEDTVRAKKQKIDTFDYFCLDDPLNCGILEPQSLTFPRLQCHYQSGY